MLRSMTGFGKAASEYNGGAVFIELSSVNHRYLDCTIRTPHAWWVLDSVIRETVAKHLSRGKVTIVVRRKYGPSSGLDVQFDEVLAGQYVDAAGKLGNLLGTQEALSLNVLAQLDGVLRAEETEDNLEEIEELTIRLLAEALANLAQMRETEGAALENELRTRVAQLRGTLATIEQRLPELNEQFEKRLKTRIKELEGDVAITEERLAIEVALMAEKGDVTEEVVRLKAHLDHALDLLGSEGPVGRRLDFLAQEIQREVNTLGGKVRDGAVSKEVVEMKAELEKFREQVQNVE